MVDSPKTAVTHALLIREPWISMILDGKKTWEIRGSATKRRGRIALVASSTGTVVGTCNLVDVVGPLSISKLRANAKKAGFYATSISYRRPHAWVVANPRRLRKPVRYAHPSGAVIWVKLSPGLARRLAR